MTRLLLIGALALVACGPSRTSYARYPGAPATFDKAASDPKAVEIAEKMFAAAGGPGNWEKAKQIRWKQVVTTDGKVSLEGEQAWDRWNSRHHGRVKQGDNVLAVGYDLYGTHIIGFVEMGEKKKQQVLDDDSRKRYVATARGVFNADTGVMLIQFLAVEPGAKLKYIGPAKDDAGNENYDEISVLFPDDPMRKDIEFRAIVDRTTNLPQRVEMVKVGTTQKVGYALTGWTTAGGLKIAASRTNLGYSGETTAISEITVGDPEEELFISPIVH